MTGLRVGSGFDIHPLVPGGPLMLGCVAIPVDIHLKGHSDGDCAAHATADALLSAALGTSLGKAFPNTDENRGISGCAILQKTRAMLDNAGFSIVNIDVSIICDHPLLKDYLAPMRASMATCLNIPEHSITVKARHVEGFIFHDTREGIAALAVVLVEMQNPDHP